MFRIFPLFRRCCSAVLSLLSAAVLRRKMTQIQRFGREWLNRMSGIGRVSGDTRTHLSDASAGLLQIPLHLQQTSAPGIEKGGIGRDAPACIFPANSGGTGDAL
jgi:hypothetical protein